MISFAVPTNATASIAIDAKVGRQTHVLCHGMTWPSTILVFFGEEYNISVPYVGAFIAQEEKLLVNLIRVASLSFELPDLLENFIMMIIIIRSSVI